MAYNEELAIRVQEILAEQGDVDERKMFGGIAFMVKGYMCCGVANDDLMLRVGSEQAQELLKDAHVRPMDFTGRPMKDYVFVAPSGLRTESALRRCVRSALDFVDSLPPK
jgi:TfoX/Sxy family transcriptional regulator of competence genes